MFENEYRAIWWTEEVKLFRILRTVYPILIRINQKLWENGLAPSRTTPWRNLGQYVGWEQRTKLGWQVLSSTYRSIWSASAPSSVLANLEATQFAAFWRQRCSSNLSAGNRTRLLHYKTLVCLQIYLSLHGNNWFSSRHQCLETSV